MQHHYPKPMIYLHWTIAMLACIAYSSRGNPIVSEWQGQIHVASGLLMGLFCILRLLVRIKYRHAIPQHSLPKWQLALASLVHWLLYFCMLGVPITGFLAISLMADRFPILGLNLSLPFFEWQIDFGNIHQMFANGFILLAGTHACVALAHHFVWKDGVLKSMLGK